MTGPLAPVALPRPERMGTIEHRVGPVRTGSGTAAGFESLLAAAVAREGLGVPSRPASAPAAAAPVASSLSSLGALFGGGEVGLVPTGVPPTGPVTMTPGAGQAVVTAAMEHLGVPYKWGGTDAATGFDCSGLVQDAFRRIGVEMPKWSRHQATMGVEVGSIEAARPGDVLAFGHPVSHVALYVGDGRMLHAPRTGEVIKIEEIDRPIASIRRIVEPGTTAPAAGTGSSTPTATLSAAELQYRPLFEEAGARWDVDPALLAAVAVTESGFDPRAVSPAGARGLMQFMPATAASLDVDPWDPASAIDGAARYLRSALDRFGRTDLAIAAYNAGPGAVARHGGIPPYPETQAYVTKVRAAWEART
ncbi:MAG: transglycosylase SLT domain-containing protein [Acidimicrobiales bacterium]